MLLYEGDGNRCGGGGEKANLGSVRFPGKENRKILDFLPNITYNNQASFRGVAKLGIALGSGPRGLGFESRHSDHRWVLIGLTDFLLRNCKFYILLHRNVQLLSFGLLYAEALFLHIGGKCVYKVKKTGYVIDDTACYRLLKKALRITYESRLWKIWRAIVTPGTCYYCASMNGRILAVDDPRIAEIPVHPNCKCYIESLSAIVAGTATNAGENGADLYVATPWSFARLLHIRGRSRSARMEKMAWKSIRGFTR